MYVQRGHAQNGTPSASFSQPSSSRASARSALVRPLEVLSIGTVNHGFLFSMKAINSVGDIANDEAGDETDPRARSPSLSLSLPLSPSLPLPPFPPPLPLFANSI